MNDFDGITLLFAIITSLFVAICEEIAFRAVLLMEFYDYHGPIKAILLSSLIFGLAHLLNISSIQSILPTLLQSLYTFGMGIVFSFLYLLHKNIIVPILMHFAFNVLNNDLVNKMYVAEWNYVFYIINIGVAIIVGLYLFFLLFKKKDLIDIN